MAQLAIEGHPTRGREIIEIFKMLGGKEVGYSGLGSRCYYYIDEYGNITGTTSLPIRETYIYALEEFLKEYPYKVGDKVKYINNIFCIKSSHWDSEKNTVIYYIDADWSAGYVVKADNLLPYKEETGKDNLVTEEDFNNTPEIEQEYMNLAENLLNQLIESTHWKCNEFDSQKMLAMFLKKNTPGVAKKDDSIIFDIPKGYEFAGVDDDNQQVVFTKIQPQYPKTFIDVLNFWNPDRQSEDDYQRCYKKDLIEKFQDLLYARDAYWKIAGEQMGLSKPWEPDFTDNDEERYGIFTTANKVVKDFCGVGDVNVILTFPTEEMRDVFYENFKDLIENCKELL